MTEADTCRKYVVPKLQATGGDNGPHSGTARARTEAIPRSLTDFLKKTDCFAQTIVFCVDQEHVDEGDIGRGHMQTFQDVETATPAILTTSQLLSTGLDAPTWISKAIAKELEMFV